MKIKPADLQLRLKVKIVKNPGIDYSLSNFGSVRDIFVSKCFPQKQQQVPKVPIFNEIYRLCTIKLTQRIKSQENHQPDHLRQ